ncbi:hypothetical protein ACQCR9_06160, partial [Ralstonia pseudosolanacearum]
MTLQHIETGARAQTPRVTRMQVIPVAGHDSMLLNLCGAHAPFFTRNLVILADSAGRTGVGEVPGGEGIRRASDWMIGGVAAVVLVLARFVAKLAG